MRTAENSDGSEKTEANLFLSVKITVRAHLELTEMLDLETWPQMLDPTNSLFIKAAGDSVGVSAGALLAKWRHGCIFPPQCSSLAHFSSVSLSSLTFEE